LKLFLQKRLLEEPGIDGRITQKWISRSGMGGGAWIGLIWLRIWTDGGLMECGNEPSGSIKCGEFLDYLRTGGLLQNNSTPQRRSSIAFSCSNILL